MILGIVVSKTGFRYSTKFRFRTGLEVDMITILNKIKQSNAA